MKDAKELCQKLNSIFPVCNKIREEGGICYLVGGSVRDYVLGKKLKDIDIEVHGIPLKPLEEVLCGFGKVTKVGKKFGVLRLSCFDVDWSLPRRDSIGRKPKVVINENMSIKDACRRRDITMNAMAIDVACIAGYCQDKSFPEPEIIDPYGGLEDMKHNRISAVDEKLFVEDPLRLFRVMQFMARFDMNPDSSLDRLSERMSLHDDARGMPIAQERVHDEFKKMILFSCNPSRGFAWLYKINRLHEILPEISVLFDIGKNAELLSSLDSVAQDIRYQNHNQEKLKASLAVLVYYVGYNQQALALSRFTNENDLKRGVRALVAHVDYVAPLKSIVDYKQLAIDIYPHTSLCWLVRFAYHQGFVDSKKYQSYERKAQDIGVWKAPEKPLLKGKDFLDVMESGELLGKVVKKAYQIQIEQGIKDPVQLKKMATQDL